MKLAKSLRSVMKELRDVARESRERKILDENSIRKLITANALTYEVFLTMMTSGVIDPKEVEEEEEELLKEVQKLSKQALP